MSMIGSDNINSIDLTQATLVLTERIVLLVEQTRSKVSAYLNSETTLMNWQIGQYIHLELKQKGEIKYGKQILATLSQQLTQKIGKGYSYSALTRMVKVAETFDEKIIATLSQQLSWSHLIELPDSADLQSVPTKRIKGGFVISAKEKPDERVLENASSLKYLFSAKSSFFGQYRKKSKILKRFEDFDNIK